MSIHAELASILAAVRAEPDDDLPRLAYADALEERGEDARAEFVRVQLARARPCPSGYSDAYHVDSPCPPCDGLFRRERVLFRAIDAPGLASPDGLPVNASVEAGPYPPGSEGPWALFRRGFVERVEMTTADFLAHAKALFSRHPITEVVLVDREPYPNGAGRVWYDVGRDMKSQSVPASAEIPTFLFRLLSNWLPEYGLDRWRAYPDEAAALADLSRACVAFGRAEAGLGEWEGVRR